jgi:uncharacterized protein YacL (UPF0231 family)
MSQVLNLVNELDDQIHNALKDLPCVSADMLGLDRRAAYSVWVDEDAVIVRKNEDRTLQYYGGFEYVDKDARIECGDYVIYTDNAGRVADCLDYYNETEEETEEA